MSFNYTTRVSKKTSKGCMAFEQVLDSIRATRRPCAKCGNPAMYQTKWRGGQAYCAAHKPTLRVKFSSGETYAV